MTMYYMSRQNSKQCSATTSDLMLTPILFLAQLHHDIWQLNILLGSVLRRNLENDILLVIGNWLVTNLFDQVAQSESELLVFV
jgi:hypothetical protein